MLQDESFITTLCFSETGVTMIVVMEVITAAIPMTTMMMEIGAINDLRKSETSVAIGREYSSQDVYHALATGVTYATQAYQITLNRRAGVSEMKDN